ncbi:hypothetical protein GOP47_0022792 [Adiantum capillus-veneris]|uniref:OBG-type G domain-containing protein n=2 Tax=Adiantum capillus-veneris TaxID=13818 RepID=A0A9D4U756_ADICA|nr:hypothetical protein GOP47_0022792 [Adiantum capillus-veneris]
MCLIQSGYDVLHVFVGSMFISSTSPERVIPSESPRMWKSYCLQIGLPNAGKSSLLAAVTRAKPEIAEYPFTTLMPNLGHLPGSSKEADGGFSKGPKMADLPGLIKGAHLDKTD